MTAPSQTPSERDSLRVAFLALVPAGTVAVWLYDVIRAVSALFPFRPALQAVDAALNDAQPGLGPALAHLAVLAADPFVTAEQAAHHGVQLGDQGGQSGGHDVDLGGSVTLGPPN